MAEFSVWKDTLPSGSIRVRHRDPKSGKEITDYVVKKHERMIHEGKSRTASWIADYYVDLVRDRYRRGTMGISDPATLTESLSDLVDKYLEDKRELAWKTLDHYGTSLKFLQLDNSITTLGELMKLNFHGWKKAMELASLSNNTIRGRINDTKMFCNWLVKKERIQKSPVPDDAMPPETKARPRFYADLEFEKLEEAIKGINHFAHIGVRLARDYGLRRVEITGNGKKNHMEGVRYEDLIWHSNGKVDLFLRPELTKGGKGPRKLRLDPDFLKLCGATPEKTGPIVPLDYDAFYRYFKRARKRSGINIELTVHGQRHTFAKDFLQKTGSNQAALRDLLGQHDVKTTEIYSQFENTYLDDTMERLHAARKAAHNGNGVEL